MSPDMFPMLDKPSTCMIMVQQELILSNTHISAFIRSVLLQ